LIKKCFGSNQRRDAYQRPPPRRAGRGYIHLVLHARDDDLLQRVDRVGQRLLPSIAEGHGIVQIWKCDQPGCVLLPGQNCWILKNDHRYYSSRPSCFLIVLTSPVPRSLRECIGSCDRLPFLGLMTIRWAEPRLPSKTHPCWASHFFTSLAFMPVSL